MRSLLFKHSIVLLIFLSLCLCSTPSYPWHDQTHPAIAKAAGYKYWFNAAGADITKIKAGDLEGLNHFFDKYENQDSSHFTILGIAAHTRKASV